MNDSENSQPAAPAPVIAPPNVRAKIWVWVGFPFGIGVMLLLLVFMGEAGGEGMQYITVKTHTGGSAKLGIADKHVGNGPPVEKGDTVLLLYTGKFKNGDVFDTNKRKKGEPMEVTVGDPNGGLIPGFDAGLVGMKKGGVRELIIPPELGYGENGIKGRIPPNSELHFEIELLQIKPMGMPQGHP